MYGEMDGYYPPPTMVRQPVRPSQPSSQPKDNPDRPALLICSSTTTSTRVLSPTSPTSTLPKHRSTPSSSRPPCAKTSNAGRPLCPRSRLSPSQGCQTSCTCTTRSHPWNLPRPGPRVRTSACSGSGPRSGRPLARWTGTRTCFAGWRVSLAKYPLYRVTFWSKTVSAPLSGFKIMHDTAFSPIEAWRRIRHPNVVSVREAFTTRLFGDHCAFTVTLTFDDRS